MSGMLDRVLASFPAHTHPLTVVSDPDDVLADEALWAALLARGFRIVRENDPFALRVAVGRNRPWSDLEPLIVVTAGPLKELPYDLWQQGRRVALDLHQIFPNLAYSLARQLGPGQRARLAAAMQSAGAPGRMLAEDETAAFLMRSVFALPPDPPPSLARLLVWLAGYSVAAEPMPPFTAASLHDRLRVVPALRELPLDELLADPDAYRGFIQRQWESYALQWSRAVHADATPEDALPLLPFATDAELRDALPALMRRGVLQPVTMPARSPLASIPQWAWPAVVSDAASVGVARLTEGPAAVEQRRDSGEARWEDWQTVVRRWAEVSRWRYDRAVVIPDVERVKYDELATWLDERFAAWLMSHYKRTAGRVLPVPHQLHHVPQWLAHQRRNQLSGGAACELAIPRGVGAGAGAQHHFRLAPRARQWAASGPLYGRRSQQSRGGTALGRVLGGAWSQPRPRTIRAACWRR